MVVSTSVMKATPELVAFAAVWNAPVVVGKSDELVVPVTYATLLGPKAIPLAASSVEPSRYVEYAGGPVTVFVVSILVTKAAACVLAAIGVPGRPFTEGKFVELVTPVK